MHSHSWRLLATGHLHLDSQLRDLSTAEDDQHEIIRDATLNAFELLIESALDHAVDLLLLTGSLCENTPTLRACTMFRDGIEAALEEGIAVSWTPTNLKEVEQLQKINCLPAGLSVLCSTGKQQRVRLEADSAHSSKKGATDSQKTRFGTVCCELISDQPPRQSTAQSTAQSNAPTTYIGLTAQSIGHLPQKDAGDNSEEEKYQLVISGQSQRCRTIRHQNRLYHSPGAIQALTNEITGPCSATLIEIDSQGEIELTPVPTSIVVREQIELTISREMKLNELLEQAEQKLLGLLAAHSYSPAKILHLSWEVRGPHPQVMQFSSLQLQEFFSPLQPLEDISILHDVALIPQLTGLKIESRDLHEKHLAEQFLQFLGDQNLQNTKKQNEAIIKKRVSQSLPVNKIMSQLTNNELCNRAAELGLLALQEKLKEAG